MKLKININNMYNMYDMMKLTLTFRNYMCDIQKLYDWVVFNIQIFLRNCMVFQNSDSKSLLKGLQSYQRYVKYSQLSSVFHPLPFHELPLLVFQLDSQFVSYDNPQYYLEGLKINSKLAMNHEGCRM